MLEQNRSCGEDTPSFLRAAVCKLGLRPFPVFVLFGPVIEGNPGWPNKCQERAISCCFPARYAETKDARLCPLSLFFSVVYRKREHRMRPERADPRRSRHCRALSPMRLPNTLVTRAAMAHRAPVRSAQSSLRSWALRTARPAPGRSPAHARQESRPGSPPHRRRRVRPWHRRDR
jgi:hypothetical protein